MENFKKGLLEIVISKKGKTTVMTWIGQSNAQNPSKLLRPYFEDVINQLENSEIAIDFSKLKYMNSSTVFPIIQFFKKLDKNGIDTVASYDAESSWQAPSFRAMNMLSSVIKHLKIKAK